MNETDDGLRRRIRIVADRRKAAQTLARRSPYGFGLAAPCIRSFQPGYLHPSQSCSLGVDMNTRAQSFDLLVKQRPFGPLL